MQKYTLVALLAGVEATRLRNKALMRQADDATATTDATSAAGDGTVASTTEPAADAAATAATADPECYTLNMHDTYGDGWNDNTFDIAGQSFTFYSGHEHTEIVCLPYGTYDVTVGGALW